MKIKALLYCTKAKPRLLDMKGEYYLENQKELDNCNPNDLMNILNGKIVCECEVETEEIECVKADFNDFIEYHYITKHLQEKELIKRSCVDFPKLQYYLKLENGYALHLSNIKVFDKPSELSDYYNSNLDYLTTAPQNMCYAYEPIQFDEINIDLRRLVVISIRPEWVCKILNGKKDIEVRRKVLKGMVD